MGMSISAIVVLANALFTADTYKKMKAIAILCIKTPLATCLKAYV